MCIYIYMLVQEVGLKKNKDFRFRIEELPDEILSLIISHLSVKEAICASTVSKRWQNQYLFMSRLNFDRDTFIFSEGRRRREDCSWFYQEKFIDLVDKFLGHYLDAKLKIESSRLSVPTFYWFWLDDKICSNRWIRTAITMGAEELDLTYQECRCNRDSLLEKFCFQILSGLQPLNLKHLHLRQCCIAPEVSEPLHSLTTLELDEVPVDVTILECIFSTCVNLRKLLLRQCEFPPKLALAVPSVSLKCLQIFNPIDLDNFEASAPELTYFEYRSAKPNGPKLSFCNVPKLEEIHLDIQFGDGRVDDMFKDFATDAPQLKRLMSLHATLDFKLEPQIPASTTILSKLEELELIFGSWRYCNLLKMIPILVACPLLQKFHLSTSGRPTNVPNMQYPTKRYPFPHLREVKIGSCYGTPSENPFVFYLLENAVALERMILTTIPRRCQYCRFKHLSHELHNQRIRAKVASTTAKLVIQHHSNEGADFARAFIR